MQLLERDDVLQRLEKLLAAARGGDGRAVLVRGEAGIGKTSAVRVFTDSHLEDAQVLWGGCDDLLTARPLGPIWDMALDEPSLGEALRGQDRYEVFALVLELMSRSLRPTVIVIEDIHWADEATLDLIKFLGRRISPEPWPADPHLSRWAGARRPSSACGPVRHRRFGPGADHPDPSLPGSRVRAGIGGRRRSLTVCGS